MEISNKIYELFVGNKKSHIIYDDVAGTWKRNFVPISLPLIMRHLRYDLTIGSYPIYKRGETEYCKWICIDIDSHERIPPEYRKEIRETYDEKTAKVIIKKLEKEYSKRINLELKEQHRNIVNILYKKSITYLGIPNKFIINEDSVGGFHLWIFLKKDTLLEDVGKWVSVYRKKINEFYEKEIIGDEEYPEIYPKQYTLERLSKKVGNGVRIPLGYNFGKEGASKIIQGDILKVEKFDLHELVKNIKVNLENLNGFTCQRRRHDVYKKQEVPIELDFWMEMPLRPCFKMIIDGETHCFDMHGHIIRMALVHECLFYKMPKETIYKCFENQPDYDPEITRIQVDSVIESSRLKDGRYSCYKIKQLGYCHNCKEYEKKYG